MQTMAILSKTLSFCLSFSACAETTKALSQTLKANRWITWSKGPNRSASVNVGGIALLFLCLRLRGQQRDWCTDTDNKDVFRAK